MVEAARHDHARHAGHVRPRAGRPRDGHQAGGAGRRAFGCRGVARFARPPAGDAARAPWTGLGIARWEGAVLLAGYATYVYVIWP
ncbi:MAG TPA: hypothetical protein DCX34_06165 [Roseovarius sp.]|nr:hypothetical protein [Roseovarius sp.]